MKCLHCGYCCTNLFVVIVDDPKLGIVKENLKQKEEGRCQHLDDDNMCRIHDMPWYKDTPCFDYTQIEQGDTNCRTGEYMLNKKQTS